jgi:hypothetical protein
VKTAPEGRRRRSEDTLPAWQRATVTACAGVIAYMLAYVGTDYGSVPHLYYFQLEREWRLVERIQGLPSGYVGLWLWALAAGVLAAGAAWIGLRWRRRPISERAIGLLTAWTITAAALAAAYYTWANWP